MAAPDLIVFDLDYTLWDCGGTWCDCLSPPFSIRKGRVQDRTGRWVRLYADVFDILQWCDDEAIQIALASRTEQPVWARELLSLLGADHRFAYDEIYPSSKLKHFAALHEASGVAYERMLFFDDEMRNIDEVGSLGVTSIYVENGLDIRLFRDGINQFGNPS